jgi:hypothetical protein
MIGDIANAQLFGKDGRVFELMNCLEGEDCYIWIVSIPEPEKGKKKAGTKK